MTVSPSGLRPRALQPLPLGSIRPAGWLAGQLRIQAGGLSGHLDEFWPDIAESGWIGGPAEGWERGPYWLDGVVPLAYLLDDPALKAKVQRWAGYILEHQQPDGWLGPIHTQKYAERYRPYDPWPAFVALKALTQYHEATGDERVPVAVERFLRRLQALLAEQPLFDWGKSRWADLVLSIYWLFERTHARWLLELAATAHAQGYDWRAHFADFQWREKRPRGQVAQPTHVVNNAMAVKAPGVWFRLSGDDEDRQAVYQAMQTLDIYHGQATGVFSGDEHYAGLNPSQGTELCAVVEYMFSLEELLAILGDARLADRLERIAFNALPAAFSPDMWAHQYDQQANQVICQVSEDPIYTSNGPYSNLFGLEPNFGCCTANFSQGWPKLATHLWMGTADDGLSAVAYAPSRVTARLGGARVQIALDTDYPFGEELRFSLTVDGRARFPLRLRIPAWAGGATLAIDRDAPAAVEPGQFHTVERTWEASSELVLHLPMRFAAQRRYHGSLALERGPLVFALRIGAEWRQIGGQRPHADWEVYPTTPWNYALALDPEHPEESIRLEQHSLDDVPFSPAGAPLVAHVRGRHVPGWTIESGAAGPLPAGPVQSQEPLEELELIPYGCSDLRVTEFPLTSPSSGNAS